MGKKTTIVIEKAENGFIVHSGLTRFVATEIAGVVNLISDGLIRAINLDGSVCKNEIHIEIFEHDIQDKS